MHKKLNQLKDLQSIDSQINRIEKSKGNLPYIVIEMTSELNVLTSEKDELQERFDNLESQNKESRSLIDESKVMLEKYKTQRNMVTNNKEYEALVNEMAYRENMIVQEQQNIIDTNSELEVLKDDLEKKIVQVNEKNEILKEKRFQLENKLNETADEEKSLAEKRNNLVANIDKHLYNLYERIYSSKSKAAVVNANDGYCGGCFTILPSQKLSELKRGDSIVQCDSCSRILFYDVSTQ